MRTTFHARQPYAELFLRLAREFHNESPARPTRFMKMMETNQGSIAGITGGSLDEDGLERKNPVIVGLGDSVTAGHFESLITMTPQELMDAMKELMANPQAAGERPKMDVEITDARESYLEKFRLRLIDKYERTSVSTINAGIAGDHLIQMAKRLDRDVIRYQPDLVLINGSLNWDSSMGTAGEYKEILRQMTRRIKTETDADLILLTPTATCQTASSSGTRRHNPPHRNAWKESASWRPRKTSASPTFTRSGNWQERTNAPGKNCWPTKSTTPASRDTRYMRKC